MREQVVQRAVARHGEQRRSVLVRRGGGDTSSFSYRLVDAEDVVTNRNVESVALEVPNMERAGWVYRSYVQGNSPFKTGAKVTLAAERETARPCREYAARCSRGRDSRFADVAPRSVVSLRSTASADEQREESSPSDIDPLDIAKAGLFEPVLPLGKSRLVGMLASESPTKEAK
jgi:hypothetical protein